MHTVAVAVLAAGAGRRMGTPKAELRVGTRRLVDRAVAVALASGCDPVLAVVRPGVAVDGASVVVNPDPDRGMRSSLAAALDAVGDVDALSVLMVDVPGVDSAAVRAVATAWRPDRVAVGRYAGGRGHPVVMAPTLWRAALELAGPDEGARAFLAAHPELVDAVDVAGDPADLDTPGDLARWRAGSPDMLER